MVFHTRAQITAAVVTVKRHFSHRSDRHRPRENKLRFHNRHAAQKKTPHARCPSAVTTENRQYSPSFRRPSTVTPFPLPPTTSHSSVSFLRRTAKLNKKHQSNKRLRPFAVHRAKGRRLFYIPHRNNARRKPCRANGTISRPPVPGCRFA